MPQAITTSSDLMRLSRELLLAEIEQFYEDSQPIPFETVDEEAG